MADVVNFPGGSAPDASGKANPENADLALDECKGRYRDVFVIGVTDDNDVSILSNIDSFPLCLWLIEAAKIMLMEASLPE